MLKYVILVILIAVLGMSLGLLVVKSGHVNVGLIIVAVTFIATTSIIPLTYNSSYLSDIYIKLNKYEILNKIGLNTIKEYYVDKTNPEEVLDYIGYDKVKEHFKDKIEADHGNRPFQKSVSSETLNIKSKLLNALTSNDEET